MLIWHKTPNTPQASSVRKRSRIEIARSTPNNACWKEFTKRTDRSWQNKIQTCTTIFTSRLLLHKAYPFIHSYIFTGYNLTSLSWGKTFRWKMQDQSMKNLEAVIKNNRWLKSECTPQFTSGPLVPFLRQWRQQSPSGELQPREHSRVTYYPTRAEDEMSCTGSGYTPEEYTSCSHSVHTCIHPVMPTGFKDNVCFLIFFPPTT